MHKPVLILRRKFELIPIKINFCMKAFLYDYCSLASG